MTSNDAANVYMLVCISVLKITINNCFCLVWTFLRAAALATMLIEWSLNVHVISLMAVSVI